jgi:lipid-binding SYLF domain-containing protein
MRRLSILAPLALVVGLGALPLAARSPIVTAMPGMPVSEEDLLRSAILVFERATGGPAAVIPRAVMMRARAIAVVPAAMRDGALYYGVGVMSGRGGLEGWTPPAVFVFQGAVPVNLEASEIDFVLIAQTLRGLDDFAAPRTMGALTRPIAPGPFEHELAPGRRSDIVAYMQFADYFAGVTVNDWELAERPASNARLYGRAYSTDDILRGAGFFHAPKDARQWCQALAAYYRATS